MATRRWKVHDPVVISFDALPPACDRRTDTLPVAKSRSSVAEHDEMIKAHITCFLATEIVMITRS